MPEANVASSGWQSVRIDELLALHKVALEARDAVEIAADAGVHLGPLRAALNETAYKIDYFPPAGTAETRGA